MENKLTRQDIYNKAQGTLGQCRTGTLEGAQIKRKGRKL